MSHDFSKSMLEQELNHFEKNLIHRLEGMGMEAGIIPGFIRNLANIVLFNSSLSLFQILVIEYWNLRFACYLVLGICTFRHKNPRQSHIAPTWPRGPGFQWKNKSH